MEPGWSSTRSAGASLGSNSSGPTAATTHGKLRLRWPRCRWVVEASITWKYTTLLNLAFLVLAGLLVQRFLKTGGPAMLRMADACALQ